MTSPNRQIFELKALHPRAWKQLSEAQKRLWVELVSAGVPVEKGFKEIKRCPKLETKQLETRPQ